MIYFCNPDLPIYRCDPEKNITCPKTNCGTSCGMTMHKEYSTDGRMIIHHKIKFTEENVNDVNIALNPANFEIVSHKTHNASGNNREAKTWEEGE